MNYFIIYSTLNMKYNDLDLGSIPTGQIFNGGVVENGVILFCWDPSGVFKETDEWFKEKDEWFH